MHDDLELSDAFPDGIYGIVLISQPGGVVSVEFHVYIVEVEYPSGVMLKIFELSQGLSDGFDGGLGIYGSFVGQSVSGGCFGDILTDVSV